MTAHARYFGASASPRWIPCPASAKACDGLEDTGSAYAEEGTKAHEIAAAMLLGQEPDTFVLSDEMLEIVTGYVERTRAEAHGKVLMVEQRVDYSETLNQPDATGTADAIILWEDTITIRDMKTGRVKAEPMPQLGLYALGALEVFGLAADYKRVRLVIDQPAIDHLAEVELTIDELMAFAAEARAAAAEAMGPNPRFAPGEKQCRWCRAKATCPALLAHVQDAVGADFDNLDEDDIKTSPIGMGSNSLGVALAAVPLIEDWCKAVRAKAESELLAGRPVSGFKLVQGRNGARKWANEADAEAKLKSMKLRVEEMYDLKLITPPMAEKLAKAGTIGPRQWPALQGLIVQKPGPPSVAPESDKRPAWSPADDFQNLDEEK